MFQKIITLIITSFFVMGLFGYCGGSRGGGDDMDSDQEAARQQELDEIEALLGVTPDRSASTTDQQTKKDDDMLGLLSSDDVPLQEQQQQPAKEQPQVKTADQNKEINRLKSQVEQKDMVIADLKAQVRSQSDQISSLESSRTSYSPLSSAGAVGDVPPGEYSSRYQGALDQFHARDYRGALQLFESLLASNASNSLSDNAQYWIGESHYALREYNKAIIDFEKVFTFPNSNKNDAAQFKLGLCYKRLGDSAKAREEFQRLLDLYPNSEYTSRAQQNLSEL